MCFRKDYNAFEKGVNAMIAEKLIAERGRDYMTARRVSKGRTDRPSSYDVC